jgi:thioredoxin-like negative regulator of GroEL
MCINVTDDDNLNKFNSSCDNGNWFVWYFADWCGHCTEMNPEWDNLKSNNINNVNLAKIRDDFISKLKPEAPVQGYPTIILYKDGKLSSIYNGERNENAFNSFLSSNTDSSTNNNNNNNNNNNSKSVKSKVTETDNGIEIDLNTKLNNSESKKKSRKKRKSKAKPKKAKSTKKKAKPKKAKSPKKKAKPKKAKSPKKKAKSTKKKAKSTKKKALENVNSNNNN